ncbi:MAG TPA: hypothetical protein ENI23_11120 [bacterium]|nr:hypothetical protein [bacterium]
MHRSDRDIYYKGKYRTQTLRWKSWDYSWDGYYFVTISTGNKVEFFGEIRKDEMNLSNIGRIVREEWLKTSEIRQNVTLDKWVVMPNHFHAIVVLGKKNIDDINADGVVEAFWQNASTQNTNKQNALEQPNKPFKLMPNSLGSIINQFKTKCTKRIRKKGRKDFAWQSRYHEHVIRNKESLERIRDYIKRNPLMWNRDRNNI